MYRKILIPTDGSEPSQAAAEHGLVLARQNGATVIFMTAVQQSAFPVELAFDATFYQELLDSTESQLAQLKAQGRRLGVETRSIMCTGDPATEILAVAEEEEVDLIVMAAHQHGRVAALLLGSVSQAILRDAPCPVLVCGEAALARAARPATPSAG